MKTAVLANSPVKGVVSPELHSHFIEFLGSCIYDGIWVGEDSSIPNIQGLRKSVVDALAAIRPPVIRWPGGCFADTYHWRNGIGPREKRPVTYNENFGTYERDTNQFGTHEFMRLCALVGAEPWLNVNMKTGSCAEMREWMEYCNREEDTDLSRERARNGSPAPFYVKYWGVGNEVWDGGGKMTAESYADEYRKYMASFPSFAKWTEKGVVQREMHPIACGPDGNKPRERAAWTKRFFKALSQFRQPAVDAYDLHFYNWNVQDENLAETEFDESAWENVMRGCMELEEVILEQYQLVQEGLAAYPELEGIFPAPPARCDLIVGEWGNWHGAAFRNRPALYQQCTMRDAVTTALMLDIFHRNCDKVKMACVAQTVNVLNSLILTEGEHTVLTPNYDVFRMYMVHRGAEALDVCAQPDEKVHLFASVKEGVLSVNLVNASMTDEKRLNLALQGEYLAGQLLCSADPHDHNTPENPDKVRVKCAPAPEKTENGFEVILPAASVQTLRFKL